jgi:hypothetical protein
MCECKYMLPSRTVNRTKKRTALSSDNASPDWQTVTFRTQSVFNVMIFRQNYWLSVSFKVIFLSSQCSLHVLFCCFLSVVYMKCTRLIHIHTHTNTHTHTSINTYILLFYLPKVWVMYMKTVWNIGIIYKERLVYCSKRLYAIYICRTNRDLRRWFEALFNKLSVSFHLTCVRTLSIQSTATLITNFMRGSNITFSETFPVLQNYMKHGSHVNIVLIQARD